MARAIEPTQPKEIPMSQRPFRERLAQRWRTIQWQAREKRRRWNLAYRYARGTLTEADAIGMLWEIEDASGHFALESISRDSMLEDARARFGDRPELAGWVADAVSHVARKWDSDGHLTGAAEDWAYDKIEEYAEQDGVELDDAYDPYAEADTEEQDA